MRPSAPRYASRMRPLARPNEWLKSLLARPDGVALELGAGGELLVARLRAALSLLIVPMPLIAALGGGREREVLIGLGAAVLVNAMAQVWLALARRDRPPAWLPWASSAYDITTTTAVLALLGLGDPVAALNSLVVWPFYLLAITLTALRNDGRLCLGIGALAIVQYAIVITVVMLVAGGDQGLLSIDYGSASVATQAQRLILLLMMALLAAALVYRMQRLVDMSGSDAMTGLPNRTWLLHGMPRVFESIRGEGGSLTMALLDLDHFRRINDEIGPREGDRALRHFVAAAGEILVERERMVRIGGQEFVLLLHCPIGSAWERLDRLRRGMAEHPFMPLRKGEPHVLAFSGGLAAYPVDGLDVSGLLGSADRRLQLAKREGRNRVVARDV